jgi:hypothetical protein
MRIPFWLVLPVALGPLFLACGGGGGGSSAPAPAPVSSFTVAPAALTLPVPPASNVVTGSNPSYPPPYSGTVTLTVARSAGFTGAVTLTLAQASLPTNVKAGFANPSDSTGLTTLIPASSTTATLSIQAGYPNPGDATFTQQLYPALGSYTIPIAATAAGATGTNGSLALNLIQEPADFALAFVTADGTTLNDFTNLSLVGTSLSQTFMAYWATGTYTSFPPVVLSTQGLPSGLGVAFVDPLSTQPQLDDVLTITLMAQSGLQAGTYSFLITGSFQGVTHTLPVIVTYSPYPFSLQTPLSSTVTLAQGQTATFPMYLWHNDAFYGTTTPTDGTNPTYVGATNLTPSAPSGLTVAFSNADPTGLSAVPLSITASPTLSAGSYTVTLQATRTGAGGVAGNIVAAAPLSLTVAVNTASTPTLWIQNVEWGQSVVAPNLRLVGGKPALLRVQLLADRNGVPAPPVTATIKGRNGTTLDTVTLLGPGTVPMTVNEGDLPTASSVSASTYAAILPATDIQPGMQVTIQAAGAASQTLGPSVDPGHLLNLVAVPITCQGVAPVLPADSVLSQELTAFWPVQSVNVTHRAPYTTSTVIPQPSSNPLNDTSGDGWVQLLLEMASLRIVDGSTANYYGFFNPGLQKGFTSSIAGISLLGDGTGIGVDVTTASLFQNDDPTLDLATTIMVHEVGHAFNLNHAPAGGAGLPQLNYPYSNFQTSAKGGAVIGAWGFDPVAQKAYDPSTYFDVMSYATATHWVSDWDYLSALGFLGETENPPVSLGAVVASGAADQWVVSGWIRPDGQIRLSPLVRVACAPVVPKAGALNLVLESSSTARTVPFAATLVPDLPAGYQHFAFTVPAREELTSAEVRAPGGQSARRAITQSLADRAMAVAASSRDGSLVAQEAGDRLHLEWDAQTHPFVSVYYEGSSRTTLALNLTGGSADLALTGLPAHGQFVIHYSDGLNAVARITPRQLQP